MRRKLLTATSLLLLLLTVGAGAFDFNRAEDWYRVEIKDYNTFDDTTKKYLSLQPEYYGIPEKFLWFNSDISVSEVPDLGSASLVTRRVFLATDVHVFEDDDEVTNHIYFLGNKAKPAMNGSDKLFMVDAAFTPAPMTYGGKGCFWVMPATGSVSSQFAEDVIYKGKITAESDPDGNPNNGKTISFNGEKEPVLDTVACASTNAKTLQNAFKSNRTACGGGVYIWIITGDQ